MCGLGIVERLDLNTHLTGRQEINHQRWWSTSFRTRRPTDLTAQAHTCFY